MGVRFRIMHPKKYLKLTLCPIKEAAKQLGYTREHLTSVLNGKTPCGQKLAVAFEVWSKGYVNRSTMMHLIKK